mgnify:CR=1 FL=1
MTTDILVVDDEKDIRSLVSGVLRDQGIQTREAWDSTTTYAELHKRVPSLILLDIWLEGSPDDGLEILAKIRKQHEGIAVIMISGHGNIETAVKATRLGAYDFIEKPFEVDRLLLIIERALEANKLRKENVELRRKMGSELEIIGHSTPISTVRQLVERVAPTQSRVLIEGPPGSGKEVVARIIHQKSPRSDGPFIALNSALMTPSIVEAELFGSEQGVDSAKGSLKIGTFEQAHGGTLFIDEVADMPIETQGKILRVLQEQSFSRLGGSEKVVVDVRIIAASSRNLLSEISQKNFREDLYYRLNVVPIQIPSLQERSEDLSELVTHFMDLSSQTTGLPVRFFADEAIALMQTCEWPGNVRQLKNLVEWILIMAPGGEKTLVDSSMLPPELLSSTPSVLRPNREHEVMALPLREAREVFERQYLETQINRFGNNVSRTASFVGMERSALHRKLKSLGISSVEKT